MEYIFNEYPSILDINEEYTSVNAPMVIQEIYPGTPMRYSITVPILYPEARRKKGFDVVCMNMIDYMNVSYENMNGYIYQDSPKLDVSTINQIYTTCSKGLSLTVPTVEIAKIHIMDMVNLKFLVFNELLRVILEHSYTPFRSIFPELDFKCILEIKAYNDGIKHDKKIKYKTETTMTTNCYKLTTDIFSHLKYIFKRDIQEFINSLIPDNDMATLIYEKMSLIKPKTQFTHVLSLLKAPGASDEDVATFIGIIDDLNKLYHATIQTEIIRLSKHGADAVAEPYLGAEDKSRGAEDTSRGAEDTSRGAEDTSGGRRTKRKLFLKYKKRKSFRNSFSSRSAFT